MVKHIRLQRKDNVLFHKSLVGMGSNIAAVVAIIKYVMCLTRAKFADKANVEIALKKKIY